MSAMTTTKKDARAHPTQTNEKWGCHTNEVEILVEFGAGCLHDDEIGGLLSAPLFGIGVTTVTRGIRVTSVSLKHVKSFCMFAELV